MDPAQANPPPPARPRVPGEAWVWLTAMGLGTGLLMVAALLGVIIANGLPVFWPARIAEVTLQPGTTSPLGETRVLLGEITQERPRAVPVRTTDGERAEDQTEIQLFLGNRGSFREPFVFLDRASVASITHPSGVLMVERLEYGDAIGFPVSLEFAGRPAIMAGDPAFSTALQAAVLEAGQTREAIEGIEKGQIGRINTALRRLEGRPDQASIDRRAALDREYAELAAKARVLRQNLEHPVLQLRLSDGSTTRIAAGQIMAAYFPNDLDLAGRAGRFAANVRDFLLLDPREANTEGGVFPAIFGTFVMTLLMSVAVVPFGVVAAIYLRLYARQGLFVRGVRIAVNNLAGVPSIVFGVFGLGFFVYFVGGSVDQLFFGRTLPTPTFGTGGIFWASLTLALMTVPVVIVATEEAIAAVPRGMSEGSMACGASKWQTIQRIILPASLPGILTGLILAMARGAGEVAPLMMVGVVKLAPSLPLDTTAPFLHLERKFMHLGFHIYDLGFQSPDSEAARPMVFATTLLLIGLVVLLNLTAILVRERLRRRYATGAF